MRIFRPNPASIVDQHLAGINKLIDNLEIARNEAIKQINENKIEISKLEYENEQHIATLNKAETAIENLRKLTGE